MKIKDKSEAQSGGRGGTRAGAGRPAGSANRSTVEQKARISEIARAYTDDALVALAKIAKFGKSESARVAAACALLDRAYGKPPVAARDFEPAENSVARMIAELQDRGRIGRMPIRQESDQDDG